MKKIFYNKLVRDSIPKVIAEKGSRCLTKKLTAKEFDEELLKKVGEEASGLMAAKKRKEIIAELGDILDVIDEIKKRKKITEKELSAVRREAMKRKGGFEKRLFLVWSSDDSYKTNERKGE